MTTQVRGARGSGKGSVSTAHFVKAAVAICSSQEIVHEFPLSASQLCTKMSYVISTCHLGMSLRRRDLYSGFADEISKLMTIVGVQHFILPLLRSLGERCVDFYVFFHDLIFV